MQENYIVGIYARLSRDDERAGESVSIENQKEMLSRYVREQGWTLYDYYCDDGVSGTTFDRPGLNRLVQDATDHKINLVLCKDLSRLGRDYIEAGKYTDFVFPSLGCRFIALNDGVDTLRKNNEMLVILKNVMNLKDRKGVYALIGKDEDRSQSLRRPSVRSKLQQTAEQKPTSAKKKDLEL